MKIGDFVNRRTFLYTPICLAYTCTRYASVKGYCSAHSRQLGRTGQTHDIAEKDASSLRKCFPREYRIWSNMKHRCENSSNSAYRRYGMRGINVCNAWRNSFDTFVTDMGACPSPIHQIDRIDNDRGYSKDNCRWVTSAENNRNKYTVKLTDEIVKKIRTGDVTTQQWSIELGVDKSHLYKIRNNKKWRSV